MHKYVFVLFLMVTSFLFSNDVVKKSNLNINNYVEFKVDNVDYLVLLDANFQNKEISNNFVLNLYKKVDNDNFSRVSSKRETELSKNIVGLKILKTKDPFFEGKLLKVLQLNNGKRIVVLPMEDLEAKLSYGFFLIENNSFYFINLIQDVKEIKNNNGVAIVTSTRFNKPVETVLNDMVSNYILIESKNMEELSVNDLAKYEAYNFTVNNQNYAVVFMAKDYSFGPHNMIINFELALYKQTGNVYKKIHYINSDSSGKDPNKTISSPVFDYKNQYKIFKVTPFFKDKIFQYKLINGKPFVILPTFLANDMYLMIFSVENDKLVLKESLNNVSSIIETKDSVKILFKNKTEKTL